MADLIAKVALAPSQDNIFFNDAKPPKLPPCYENMNPEALRLNSLSTGGKNSGMEA